MNRILLVEDDDSLRSVLKTVLESEGFAVDAFPNAEKALGALPKTNYACVLSDFKLPGKNGLELLRETREISPSVPFVIMTAFGSIDISVEAMKLGANDFICKPFEPHTLNHSLKQIIEHRRILDRSLGLGTRRERKFLSVHPSAEKLLHQARKVARVDTSVLLLGESGVGKELIARYIHEHSHRADRPFIAVNCAALPADLLESEFFGHEAGAFTGATQSRIGVLEFASEGTIFLDEIGDMPLALQVKLLRAIQEREVRRIGSNKSVKINPRIISATNRNIEEILEEGLMRDDFYYRLAVVTLEIPPLRERPEDIVALAENYLAYFAEANKKPTPKLQREALSALLGYSWPGNARELENVIERAVVLAEGEIEAKHLGINLNLDLNAIREATLSLPEISQRAAQKAEIEAISRILNQTSGNKSKAAQLLGVSYKTLLNKVKEYGIERLE